MVISSVIITARRDRPANVETLPNEWCATVLTWDDGRLEVPELPAPVRAPGAWVVLRRFADQALVVWRPHGRSANEIEIHIVFARDNHSQSAAA